MMIISCVVMFSSSIINEYLNYLRHRLLCNVKLLNMIKTKIKHYLRNTTSLMKLCFPITIISIIIFLQFVHLDNLITQIT